MVYIFSQGHNFPNGFSCGTSVPRAGRLSRRDRKRPWSHLAKIWVDTSESEDGGMNGVLMYAEKRLSHDSWFHFFKVWTRSWGNGWWTSEGHPVLGQTHLLVLNKGIDWIDISYAPMMQSSMVWQNNSEIFRQKSSIWCPIGTETWQLDGPPFQPRIFPPWAEKSDTWSITSVKGCHQGGVCRGGSGGFCPGCWKPCCVPPTLRIGMRGRAWRCWLRHRIGMYWWRDL